MTTSTVTLVGDVSDLIGNDYDPSRTKVWVQHNTDKVVTDSGPIRLGAATKAVSADGTFSFANVVASTSLVENLQATLWVDWPNTAGPERTRRQVSFGPYDLTGLSGTVDIRTLEETQALDPVASSALLSEMQDLRDEQVAISGIDSTDTAVAYAVQHGATTPGVLSASYGPPIVVTAEPYNAKGDGITDDTAAIQAAINESTGASPRQIYFPNPVAHYKLTDELLIPAGANGTKLVGESKAGVVLKQYANGKAIIAERSELHSIEVRSLTLSYNTQQTTLGGSAFWYQGSQPSNNFYLNVFADLFIEKAFRCWSVADLSGGVNNQSLWASKWDDISCALTKDRVLCPSRGTGSPSNTIDNFHVYNTGDVSLISSGPAFDFLGVAVNMNGISVEGWSNEVFYIDGGARVTVKNLSIEAHRVTKSIARICFVLPAARLSIDNWAYSAVATASNTAWHVFFCSQSDQLCELTNGQYTTDQSAASAYLCELVYASENNAVVERNNLKIVPFSGTNGMFAPGTGASRMDTARQLAPKQVTATRRETTAYQVTALDHLVISNGAPSITLPSSNTVPAGHEVIIKNENASSVLVTSAGGENIDGSASKTLTQYQALRVVSTNVQWLVI